MRYPKICNKEELKLFKRMISFGVARVFEDVDVKNGGKNIVLISDERDKNGKEVVIIKGNGEIGTYPGGEDYVLSEMDLFDLYFEEGITKIKAETFQGRHIEHCMLPESMEELGEYSFAECPNLESIIIPNGLKYIRKKAFKWCAELRRINLPSTIEFVDEDAFYECDDITIIVDKPKGSLAGAPWGADNARIIWEEADGVYITDDGKELFGFLADDKEYIIPDGIKRICRDAFRGSKLEKITIPDSVKKIGGMAFGYSMLKEIRFGKGIKELEMWAFAHCKYLTKVDIPFGVTNLVSTFMGCTSLESVTLPNTIKTLRLSVFRGCSSLKELYIPDSVEEMDGVCFAFILNDGQTESKIERLEVDKNNKNFVSENGAIYSKDKSRLVCASTIGGKSFTVPDTVKSIDRNAFGANLNWEKIIVPNDVVVDDILYSFFQNINIDYVEIPSAMYEKKRRIFDNCKIKQLVIKGEVQSKEEIKSIASSCEIDEIIFE
jgi:hypothetical protein